MPKPRAPKLETATARLRLPFRPKPRWVTVGRNQALGYRRNRRAGSWSVRGIDATGREYIRQIGLADDLEPADGRRTLSYWQALELARAVLRQQNGEGPGGLLTVAGAVDLYEADLRARGAEVTNASILRKHLPAALAARPVKLLAATELRRWRDSLLEKELVPASVNRTATNLRSALNFAASCDESVVNVRSWKIGLSRIADAHKARDAVLTDEQVRRLVVCAYAIHHALGLFVEVLAVTGTRTSQAAKLRVMDLQVDAGRILMASSKKGGKQKVIRRYPVPIASRLAVALAEAAEGRAPDAPLLLDPLGDPWGHSRNGYRQRRLFRQVVKAAGLEAVTPISLRHSSIVRSIQRGLAIRLIAAMHDTGVSSIERNYSAFITSHSDEITRAAMLDLDGLAS